MRAKFVDVNGVRTRYLHEGSGHPLLLIHGSGAFADNFYKNIDVLAKGCHIYAPDMIGHGFTEPIAFDGVVYPHMVDHLAGLVDTLEFDRFSLAGWSLGGLISSLLYFKMPERVDKLILISSGSTFNTDEQMGSGREGNRRNVESTFADLSLESMRRRHLGSVHPSASPPEEILMSHLTSYATPGVKEFFERMAKGNEDIDGVRRYRVYEKLEDIKVPTLVMAGKEDPRAVFDSVAAGAKRIPKARFVPFDQCGHRPFYEHPDKFNSAVLDFLRESD
jgi:pimeloyl-ACP methyl ester carboxylesterase